MRVVSVWCDRCQEAETVFRVEYCEGAGSFRSRRWVQDVCQACCVDKEQEATDGTIWDLSITDL